MNVQLRKDGDVGFVEFDQKDSKVNVLNSEVLKELDKVLNEAEADKDLKVLAFISKKKDVFIAGADIKEIENITEADDGAAKAKAGQDIFNRIEDFKIPTVAVIDGVALGGGCELALACNFRVATGNANVKIGLPEVGLGFVPGFGGTYRLPRVIGIFEGLNMILTQAQVNSSKALRIGLVDKLIPENDIDTYLFDYLQRIIDGKVKWSQYEVKFKNPMQFILESSLFGNYLLFSGAKKKILKSPNRFYPAPLKAIEVIKKTFYCGREKGLRLERQAFGELAITPISKNLVRIYYLMQKFKKLGVSDKEIRACEISKCGVLGAGVMGGGIAQLLSSRDILVRMKDINNEAILHAFAEANKIFQKGVKRRKIKKDQAQMMMGKISSTLDYSGFKTTDMVIEAVIENMDIKKKVFKELSETTNKDTVLATNTSALSVAEMAKETKDPSKVIGLHFFNPVYRMPLVEVITTPETSQETLATTLGLVKKLGKTPIIVKDSCGFVVNRILLAYINEAGRLLEETGEMLAIDKIMTDFGMPMGPFVLSDEVGLDVGFKVLNILDSGFSGHFKPVDIFERIYSKGWLGKKTGKGYYIHKAKRIPNPEVKSLLPKSFKALDKEEALNRMIYIMINEAAKCLEEKIVDDPDAIDVGMIFGTGFPPFKGGLLRYADSITTAKVVENLESLCQKTDSDRFKPAQYLVELSKKNKSFLE